MHCLQAPFVLRETDLKPARIRHRLWRKQVQGPPHGARLHGTRNRHVADSGGFEKCCSASTPPRRAVTAIIARFRGAFNPATECLARTATFTDARTYHASSASPHGRRPPPPLPPELGATAQCAHCNVERCHATHSSVARCNLVRCDAWCAADWRAATCRTPMRRAATCRATTVAKVPAARTTVITTSCPLYQRIL
jgi:hypothetical protein